MLSGLIKKDPSVIGIVSQCLQADTSFSPNHSRDGNDFLSVLKAAYYIIVYEQHVEVKYLGLAINGMNLQASE